MGSWFVNQNYSAEIRAAFANLDRVCQLQLGEKISASSISRVNKLSLHGQIFYIKSYRAAGKNIRKFLGRSRVRREWENLAFCKQLGICVPNLVAYGERYEWSGLKSFQGVIITEEIPNAADLMFIAQHHPEIFNHKEWRGKLIRKMANYISLLHRKQFIHYDLHWRNILVTKDMQNPEVYLFDIPCGRIRKLFFPKGIKRDLFYIYKGALKFLSRTDQLRFYLEYKKSAYLTYEIKQEIKKLFVFFDKKIRSCNGTK